MTALEGFIESMEQKYGGEAKAVGRASGSSLPDGIPQPLVEFYTLYESAVFPFGEIWSAGSEDEQQIYFRERGWFNFGFDFYFSYWLCSCEPDGSGMRFTSWDHDSETEPEAIYGSLTEFLTAVEEEYTGN